MTKTSREKKNMTNKKESITSGHCIIDWDRKEGKWTLTTMEEEEPKIIEEFYLEKLKSAENNRVDAYNFLCWKAHEEGLTVEFRPCDFRVLWQQGTSKGNC